MYFKRSESFLEKERGVRFTLGERIGAGAYGVVYHGTEKSTHKHVAVKVLKHQGDEGISATTIREISILQNHKHPNIVRILGIENRGKKNPPRGIAMAMDYCGKDLSDFVRGLKNDKKWGISDRIDISVLKSFMNQLLGAVAFLHAHGVMHRDIKPHNVLYDHVEKPNIPCLKLCDFGLARTSNNRKKHTPEVVTLFYRPPELLVGTKKYSNGIDIWSLACVFAELVLAEEPFRASDITSCRSMVSISQLTAIFEKLGAPKKDSYLDRLLKKSSPGLEIKREMFEYVDPRVEFFQQFDDFDKQLGLLLRAMFQYDPKKRITAEQALTHPFFTNPTPVGEKKKISKKRARFVGQQLKGGSFIFNGEFRTVMEPEGKKRVKLVHQREDQFDFDSDEEEST